MNPIRVIVALLVILIPDIRAESPAQMEIMKIPHNNSLSIVLSQRAYDENETTEANKRLTQKGYVPIQGGYHYYLNFQHEDNKTTLIHEINHTYFETAIVRKNVVFHEMQVFGDNLILLMESGYSPEARVINLKTKECKVVKLRSESPEQGVKTDKAHAWSYDHPKLKVLLIGKGGEKDTVEVLVPDK